MKHATPLSLRRRAADNPEIIAGVPAARANPDVREADEREQRWKARPHAALAVQLLIVAIPLAACVVCSFVLASALPHPTHLAATVLWWVVIVGASTLVLMLGNRIMRRFLPLALLLRLSMLFPDRAPKRYLVAARAWSSRRLREEIARERAGADSYGNASGTAATQILALMANLAAHDSRTRGHCERVRVYNDMLAEELGLSADDRDRLRWAALIHDIGKLKIPHRLLNKPERPTTQEWELLRAHPARGAQIVAPLAHWLGPWADTIEQHHERWDGTGYPQGLAGHDICLGARIVAVADAFEVMTSLRPYGRPVTAEQARTELAECAGTHFDPLVVRAFLNLSIGPLRKAMGLIVVLAQVPLLVRSARAAEVVRRGGPAAAGAGVAVAVAMTAAAPVTGSALASARPTQHAKPPIVVVPATPRTTVRSAPTHHTATKRTSAPTASAPRPVRPAEVVRAAPLALSGTASVAVPAPPPTTSPPPTTLRPGHGRCAGDSGSGIGNGGSTRLHGSHGHATRAGRLHARGLSACG